MKSFLQLFCLLLSSAGLLMADLPRKPVPSKYRSLWTDSPFTTKPVATVGPVYNPLEDYVLLGVSPVEEGYRVTMMNRKKPADLPLIVETNKPTEGFEIVEIVREQGDPMGTKVKMKRGSSTGTVSFEEKFLALKTAPKPAQRSNPNPQAQTQGAEQPTQRVPRRRIIPPTPPVPGAQNTNSSNNRSDNPTSRGVPGVPNPNGR